MNSMEAMNALAALAERGVVRVYAHPASPLTFTIEYEDRAHGGVWSGDGSSASAAFDKLVAQPFIQRAIDSVRAEHLEPTV